MKIWMFCLCLLLSVSSMYACGPMEGADSGVVLDLTQPPVFTQSELAQIQTLSPLPALPKSPSNRYADRDDAIRLGQYLFFEKRLSANKEVSCATCHDPSKQWSDQRAFSKGIAELTRHSPSLWNVAYNRWYFWDGRADSLWAQALKPLEAVKEMGTTRLQLLHVVAGDKAMRTAYEKIFGALPDVSDTARFPLQGKPNKDNPDDPHHKAWVGMKEADQKLVNTFFTNIAKAIAAYERTIISKDSPFDTFVDGVKGGDKEKQKELSIEAQWGLKIFLEKDSCVTCHNGPNLTDREFHNIGLPKHPTRSIEPDIGRFDGIPAVLGDPFNTLGAYSDAPDDVAHNKVRYLNSDPQATSTEFGSFKTPTLRNVALSGPFMHDGRFKTLDEVLSFYSLFGAKQPERCLTGVSAIDQPASCKRDTPAIGHQEETMRVLKLSPSQLRALKAFLMSLTGQPLPTSQTTQPSLGD